jgi:hypothetical protein
MFGVWIIIFFESADFIGWLKQYTCMARLILAETGYESINQSINRPMQGWIWLPHDDSLFWDCETLAKWDLVFP